MNRSEQKKNKGLEYLKKKKTLGVKRTTRHAATYKIDSLGKLIVCIVSRSGTDSVGRKNTWQYGFQKV